LRSGREVNEELAKRYGLVKYGLRMKLVVDANVLFSFFKKGSTTRELILDPELKYDLDLFAPVLEEVGKHKDEICFKFGLSPQDFNIMFCHCLRSKRFIRAILSNGRENIRPAFEFHTLLCVYSSKMKGMRLDSGPTRKD